MRKRYEILGVDQCDELAEVLDFIIERSPRKTYKVLASNTKKELLRHKYSSNIKTYQVILTGRQSELLRQVVEAFGLVGYKGKFET